MRRMANAQGGAPEATAPRGMLIGGPDPEYIREQQDRDRTRLAERLLEIGLETLIPNHFSDTAEQKVGDRGYDTAPQISVEDWYRKNANAAMLAAEVVYPEIPEPQGGAVGQVVATHGVLPHTAQEAESVMDKAAYPNDPRRTLREGCWEMTPEEYQRRLAAGEVGDRTVVIDHSGSVGRFPEEPRSPATGMESVLDAAGDVHPDEQPIRGEG